MRGGSPTGVIWSRSCADLVVFGEVIWSLGVIWSRLALEVI